MKILILAWAIILLLIPSFTFWGHPQYIDASTLLELISSGCLLSMYCCLQSKNSTWKIISGNVFVLLLLLAFLDVFLLIPPLGVSGVFRMNRNLVDYDEILGYVFKKKNIEGVQQIGRPTSTKESSAKDTIVTIGCSYTFGSGVEALQAWPAQMQSALDDFRVINLGVSGYGGHQFLAMMQQKGFPPQINPKYVIYMAIPDHVRRLVSPPPFYDTPWFILNQGHLEHKGHFMDDFYSRLEAILTRSVFAKNKYYSFSYYYTFRKLREEDIKLYVAVVKELEIIIQKKYGSKFIVVFFPEDKIEFNRNVFAKLSNAGLKIISLEDIISPIFNRNNLMLSEHEHPNAETHRKIGLYLANYIKKDMFRSTVDYSHLNK